MSQGTRAARREAAAATAAAAMPAEGAPAPFSLTPYTAVNGVIDFSTPDGRKFYERATAPLSSELFDCQPDKLRSFLENLERRAQAFGWSTANTGITMIPDDLLNLANTTHRNLITNYGQLTIAHIHDYEDSYIHSATRYAQDTTMLYHCLMNSISSSALDSITIWKEDYTVVDKPSGNLLLKIIIRESHIDTNATEAHIRQKLSSLDQYMVAVSNDVAKFNAYVKQQVQALAARGAKTEDLLSNLFKGYLACTDRVFCRYIEKKLESYEEGTNITPNELMVWAKTKFHIIKQNNLWCNPSPEQKEIMALKVEVQNLKKTKSQPKPKTEPGSGKGKGKGKEKGNRTPAWIFQAPAASEANKTKTWKDFTWYWCGKLTGGKCERYRQHSGPDCKGLSRWNQRQQAKENPKPTRQPTKRKQSTSKPNSTKKVKIEEALEAAKSNVVDDDEVSISS